MPSKASFIIAIDQAYKSGFLATARALEQIYKNLYEDNNALSNSR